jgi:uncharacterized protein
MTQAVSRPRTWGQINFSWRSSILVVTIIMPIDYDPDKRAATLLHRGLDMADAAVVFVGPTLTFPDLRQAYGEERMVTYGLLESRMVVIAWTQRGNNKRVISMRKANEREQARYLNQLD